MTNGSNSTFAGPCPTPAAYLVLLVLLVLLVFPLIASNHSTDGNLRIRYIGIFNSEGIVRNYGRFYVITAGD